MLLNNFYVRSLIRRWYGVMKLFCLYFYLGLGMEVGNILFSSIGILFGCWFIEYWV